MAIHRSTGMRCGVLSWVPAKMLSATAALLLVLTAQAQAPGVPRDFYENRRQVQGDQLTFCIHNDALTAEFDRSVATALANALLLESAFYEVDPPHPIPPLDYRIPLLYEEIFVFMTDYCDAFMGWAISSSGRGYPEWLTLSRVYYQTRLVLATENDSYDRLRDIPAGERIGTLLGTSATSTMSTYMRTMTEGNRWLLSPYPNNPLLIERLLDGTLSAAIIWEPALFAATGGDPASEGIRVIPIEVFEPLEVRFGIALRARDPFLRTMLDDAIVALVNDGTIESLLEDHGIPGRAGALGR